MDEVTKEILDNFFGYLAQETQDMKHGQDIRFIKWSLKDFKLTIDVMIHDEHEKIYFDVREVKDNKDRFYHLLDNAKDQLSKLLVE